MIKKKSGLSSKAVRLPVCLHVIYMSVCVYVIASISYEGGKNEVHRRVVLPA